MLRLKKMILFITVAILVGCSVSEQEALQTIEQSVVSSFESNPKEPSNKTDEFSYYLPSGFHVESETDYNVVLKKGDQTFILFVNPFESKGSKEIYSSIKKQASKNIIFEKTFEDKERFGFIQIRSIDKNLYELIIGVGGAKVTTKAGKRDLVSSMNEMMEIVNSVKY